MIARMWRGATRAQDADIYLGYLHETGLKEYRDTAGNLGVMAFRRVDEAKAEFLLVSLWESEDAIRAFAGDSLDRAVYYPEDERFLIEKDEHVQHFECVHFEAEVSGTG